KITKGPVSRPGLLLSCRSSLPPQEGETVTCTSCSPQECCVRIASGREDNKMNNVPSDPPMCAGPHLDTRKPALKLPPKAADCHCHVFGPRDRYPWAANRLYTPPPVLLDDYLGMLAATGFERGVMVQTGLYGPDNRFIVDAIKAHPGRLRAIALIGEDITDRAL